MTIPNQPPPRITDIVLESFIENPQAIDPRLWVRTGLDLQDCRRELREALDGLDEHWDKGCGLSDRLRAKYGWDTEEE